MVSDCPLQTLPSPAGCVSQTEHQKYCHCRRRAPHLVTEEAGIHFIWREYVSENIWKTFLHCYYRKNNGWTLRYGSRTLTQWFLAAIKKNVRQQVGFYGWLWSLQGPPYNQVNYTGGCAHKINHLSVAHIAHICCVHLQIGSRRGDNTFILAPLPFNLCG